MFQREKGLEEAAEVGKAESAGRKPGFTPQIPRTQAL